MKYKLINRATNEAHMCDKVTIDGFDYYVSDKKPTINTYFISRCKTILAKVDNIDYSLEDSDNDGQATIRYNNGLQYLLTLANTPIATNNPSIDIPKVVDDVEELTNELLSLSDLKSIDGTYKSFHHQAESFLKGVKEGYNKSQETHPFTDEDMIEFAEFKSKNLIKHCDDKGMYLGTKKVFQLWKSQQPKVLYYEAN